MSLFSLQGPRNRKVSLAITPHLCWVWAHLPALCQCLRGKIPPVSDPPVNSWTCPPHLPAQLGAIIIDFIMNFLLYTSKYLGFIFSTTSGHRAELTEVPAWPAPAPEGVQATGNQGVGWWVQIFPWSEFYFPPTIVWLLKWSSPKVT